MPIIKSLAETVGSLPGKTANKMGAYLIGAQMQAMQQPPSRICVLSGFLHDRKLRELLIFFRQSYDGVYISYDIGFRV